MAQVRTHDYRAPRSTEGLNKFPQGIIPVGVYEGLQVSADGTISAGWLLTAEGVRIEETEAISVVIPAADLADPRIDLIVCRHEYEKTVPAPVATFEVIEGIPFAVPVPPDLPEFCTLLAIATLPATDLEWSLVVPVAAPIRVHNAVDNGDGSWSILHGASGAMRMEWSAANESGYAELNVYMVAPGVYGDGDPITWGDPAFTIRDGNKIISEWGLFTGSVEIYDELSVAGPAGFESKVEVRTDSDAVGVSSSVDAAGADPAAAFEALLDGGLISYGLKVREVAVPGADRVEAVGLDYDVDDDEYPGGSFGTNINGSGANHTSHMSHATGGARAYDYSEQDSGYYGLTGEMRLYATRDTADWIDQYWASHDVALDAPAGISASHIQGLLDLETPGSLTELHAVTKRRLCAAWAQVDADGSFVGGHFNVLSVAKTATGTYSIVLDIPGTPTGRSICVSALTVQALGVATPTFGLVLASVFDPLADPIIVYTQLMQNSVSGDGSCALLDMGFSIQVFQDEAA